GVGTRPRWPGPIPDGRLPAPEPGPPVTAARWPGQPAPRPRPSAPRNPAAATSSGTTRRKALGRRPERPPARPDPRTRLQSRHLQARWGSRHHAPAPASTSHHRRCAARSPPAVGPADRRLRGDQAAPPTSRSGDLLAPGPGHGHRLVLIAVLAVVVDRQLGGAAQLPAHPPGTEGAGRPIAARQRRPSHHTLSHVCGQRAPGQRYSAPALAVLVDLLLVAERP